MFRNLLVIPLYIFNLDMYMMLCMIIVVICLFHLEHLGMFMFAVSKYYLLFINTSIVLFRNYMRI